MPGGAATVGLITGAVVDANGLSGRGWGDPMGGNSAGVAMAASGPAVGTVGNTLDGAGIDGIECVPTFFKIAGPDTTAVAAATTAIVPVISSDSRTGLLIRRTTDHHSCGAENRYEPLQPFRTRRRPRLSTIRPRHDCVGHSGCDEREDAFPISLPLHNFHLSLTAHACRGTVFPTIRRETRWDTSHLLTERFSRVS